MDITRFRWDHDLRKKMPEKGHPHLLDYWTKSTRMRSLGEPTGSTDPQTLPFHTRNNPRPERETSCAFDEHFFHLNSMGKRQTRSPWRGARRRWIMRGGS